LKIDSKEIILTTRQAKKLKEALDELFGKKIVREVHRDYWPYRDYYPWYPYWTWQKETPQYTYGTNTGSTISPDTLLVSYNSANESMAISL
jgi:hypothetical protein